MKTTINFTSSPDDLGRYSSPRELKEFYQSFGCAGLEFMPLELPVNSYITPDMVVGVHLCCPTDWMNTEEDILIAHYRKELDYAESIKAEYVVFHVAQVSEQECFFYRMEHCDEEVVDAACRLINALLDGKRYSFRFLMENLWWPGLNFLRPAVTRRLLNGVHYEKKGFMLDTGHFMHTDLNLRTQKEALESLHAMLDAHGDLVSYIKGIHLHQSLTGDYVQNWLKHPPVPETDPLKYSCQIFEHVFAIDRHLPFTDPGVRDLVSRIDPLYLTYEYITHSREEHEQYLKAGRAALA